MADKDRFPATERCDRCGAQAYVQVHVGNGVLSFCNHHYRQNAEALNSAGRVDDRSFALTA